MDTFAMLFLVLQESSSTHLIYRVLCCKNGGGYVYLGFFLCFAVILGHV